MNTFLENKLFYGKGYLVTDNKDIELLDETIGGTKFYFNCFNNNGERVVVITEPELFSTYHTEGPMLKHNYFGFDSIDKNQIDYFSLKNDSINKILSKDEVLYGYFISK